MNEPGLAGTAIAVSSVFDLERNSRSLQSLQGRYRISGGWDHQRVAVRAEGGGHYKTP
jgi:hypothetical protein